MMIEVQNHGFQFEKWVKEAFFGGYSGEYTQKWDVPAEQNEGDAVPEDFRGLPVSIKTARYGSPIGLGDAIRQREINVPFVMVAGFWEQKTASEKWFEDIGVAKFTEESWGTLWGGLDLSALHKIDEQVKNPDLHYSEARKLAREWKGETAKVSKSQIVINPKIDSKSQRRIQCSLPFAVFWNSIGRPAHRENFPTLFGREFPNPINSPSRTFSRG